MTVSIGFVLLTHNNPEQIRRLIGRLNKMFDEPPITCHHDFAKCSLPVEVFPGNVSFVLPPLPTERNMFSLVEAAIRAIKLMYKAPVPPDWFVLLSGSDYPIKPAVQIRRDLAACPYDANIHHELIDASHFERDWHHLCYDRYCKKTLFRLYPTHMTVRLHPLLSRPFLPFSPEFRCFAGEFWFCANRRVAEYILSFHTTRPALASHYRSAPIPDKSYFQCILANAPNFKLSQNDYRYIDWNHSDTHPKTLGIEDLPRLLSSADHFARKFDMNWDARILDELDALTGG